MGRGENEKGEFPAITKQTTNLSEEVGWCFLSNMARRDISPAGPGMFDNFTVDGPEGEKYVTNRIGTMISEDAQDAGDALFRRLVGGFIGLAALGAAFSDVSALQKLVAVPALSLMTYAALSNRSGDAKVITHLAGETENWSPDATSN